MGFSHPEAFYLLLLLIPLIGLILFNFSKKKKLLDSFLSERAFAKMGLRSGREIDFFKSSLLNAALIFFIIALAGPEWGERFEDIEIRGIEMIFALDTSNSMNAEDLKPSRLEFSKQLIYTIIDHFSTDYIGLINFAGSAYIQCPLTVDYEAFKLLTEATTISPEEEQGTDFSSAFSLALKSFRAAVESKKIIILITDGEDQEGKWKDMMPELEKQNIIVFTVGVGIRSGAPIPLKNSQGDIIGWKKDKKGNMVRTTLDEKTLIRIASSTGGQYFRFTDISAIDIFVNNLKSFERSVLSKRMKLSRQKQFHIPLIIGIICLIFEMFLTDKKLIWKKK
jgi:Ca-activated chloride channel family protein